MGVVYKATHEFMSGSFALKAIKPELASDPEVAARFCKKRSQVPHLITQMWCGCQAPFREGGQLFLPMEYLRGQPLNTLMEDRPGPWPAEMALG